MTFRPAYSIEQLLPHKGPIRLLDELLEISNEHIVAALTIRSDSFLCDGAAGVPAWVGLEYMAQTACAYAGREDVIAGREPRVSVLLGSRKYEARTQWFPVGARLVVSAHLAMRDENDLAAFLCSIHHGSAELARGDIKALRPRDLQALIAQQLCTPD